jgi:hypothetical protein
MGSPLGPITYDPIFGDYHGLSKYGPVVARDPSGNALYGQTVFANLPYGLGYVARGIMGRGDDTFGDFPGDVVSTPSWRTQEDIDERYAGRRRLIPAILTLAIPSRHHQQQRPRMFRRFTRPMPD